MAEYRKLRTKVVLELPRLVPKSDTSKETRVGFDFEIGLFFLHLVFLRRRDNVYRTETSAKTMSMTFEV